MAVLQKGKANYPFWGASLNLISGLDPLSLQTTSEATYATMLPGISNLTNRLRYYGFYCWLIDFYFKKEKKGNSTEQYKFIRRAELMVAIIMQSEKKAVQQITGSNFATNLINNLKGKYFDLAEGADNDGEKVVYWKYPSGAFGQYYYGAMSSLSLILAATNDDGDFIFSVSNPHPRQKVSGKELADAFDSALIPEIKDLFYNNIKKGKLSVDDIPILIDYFAIEKINQKNPEWPLYVSMLLDKDEPGQEIEEYFTYHRKETINELIQDAIENKNEYNWKSFLKKTYKFKMGTPASPVSDTYIGWYSYQFNEYFQFACGSVFWATLQYLHSLQQEQYLPQFVRKFSKLVTTELCKSLKESPESKFQQVLSGISKEQDEDTLYYSIETSPSSNPVKAACAGFLLLFQLYNANKEFLHPLKEFMNRKQTIREGNMVDGLLYFHSIQDDTFQSFIEQFILRKIIYRHQMVAIRKMGNGTQATHKFIIEEQYIRFIDTFPPRATSPRMNALFNLLSDLKIVNSDGMLSFLHKKIFSE